MDEIAFVARWVDGSLTTQVKTHMYAFFKLPWGFQRVFFVDCCNNPIKGLSRHGEMLRGELGAVPEGVRAWGSSFSVVRYLLYRQHTWQPVTLFFFCFTPTIFLQSFCSSNISFPCLANWLDLLVPNLESSCVVDTQATPLFVLKLVIASASLLWYL